MKMIKIKRLPPFALANIFAIVRILSLIVNGLFERPALRMSFGREAVMPDVIPSSFAFLALQYLVPVAGAWFIGRLFTVGYNASVKYFGWGLRVKIDEFSSEQPIAGSLPQDVGSPAP